MVTGGASAVGAHLVGRMATDVSHLVSLAGGVSLATGLVLTFGALAMVLFENVYLAIHEDHLLVHDNGRETKISWDDLTAVGIDAPRGYVELHRENEEVLRWYAGKSATHVAARIREAKRKSAHGLLNNGS